MKLTGKALKDFALWYTKSEYNYPISLLPKVLQNVIIIEFFDSVGIIINVKRYVMPLGEVEWYFIITGDNGAHLNNHVSEESRSVFDCRKNITEQAIIKANEIYNEKEA